MMRTRLWKLASIIDTDSREGRKELLMVFRRINELLCAAREEIEGKSNTYNQINITEFANYSDEELQQRKDILIAKALGNFKETDFTIGAIGAGAEAEDDLKSSQVPLASPA